MTRTPLFAAGWLAAFVVCIVPSGCVPHWTFQKNQFAPPPPVNASKDDLIRHLNANISKLYAWRSTSVQIRARSGLPMQLSAVIAVETPRNFRLRVSSIGGDEADFGSNQDHFWFWMRRNEPRHVYMARHEDLARCQHRLQIPFQPDWLMEVLGVIPLDPAQFTMEQTDGRSGTVSLISENLSPTGQPVKRVVLVDAPRGLVLGHHLYDARGALIAKATLRNHRYHPEHQMTMAHCIDLDWPQAGMAMTMTIGRDVEVNPQGLPSQTWQMPEMPGYPMFNLGQ